MGFHDNTSPDNTSPDNTSPDDTSPEVFNDLLHPLISSRMLPSKIPLRDNTSLDNTSPSIIKNDNTSPSIIKNDNTSPDDTSPEVLHSSPGKILGRSGLLITRPGVMGDTFSVSAGWEDLMYWMVR